MAGGAVPQGNYNQEVLAQTTNTMQGDAYDSAESMVDAVDEAGRDFGTIWAEVERSPEASATIVDNADGDEQLLGELLAQRRGLRGVISGLSRTMFGRFAASAAIGTTVRAGFGAVVGETSRAVSGGVVGAVGGGFWGYLRGKDQTESAATWMEELGILKNVDGLTASETIEAMSDDQLYMALGVMRNAIKSGRVRGNPEQKLEMVAKFRLIKNILSERTQEPRPTERALNPTLAKIQENLGNATEDCRQISEMAGEEYKEFYDKIVSIKKSRTTMSTIKGAIIGGTVGAVFGKLLESAGDYLSTEEGQQWLADRPNLAAALNWVQDRTESVRERFADLTGQESVEDVMRERMDDLRQGALAPEIAQHDATLDTYTSFADTPGSPVPPESMWNDGTVTHLANIDAVNPDNVYGLAGNDLASLNEMLQNDTSLRDILNFADLKNIDLTAMTGSGEKLVDLLQNNSEVFARMPADVQNFVLSHPSIADEFIRSMQADPAAFMANVSERITSVMAMAGIDTPAEQWAAGLAAAGLGFLGADAIQRAGRSGTRAEYRAQNILNNNARINFEETRRTENRSDSEQRLIGNRVTFNLANLPGYNLPRFRRQTRPNSFEIYKIDERNGRVIFRDSDFDREYRRATGNDPHPNVRTDQLLDGDSMINEDVVTYESEATRSATATEREERANNEAATRERLAGARVRLINMNLNIPRARGNEFTINSVEPDGTITFDGSEGRVPNLNISAILNERGVTNPGYIEIVREARPARAAGAEEAGAEPEEELNLRPYEALLGRGGPATIGRDTRGNVVARFAPTLAAPGPVQARNQVRIDSSLLEGLPINYAANVVLSTVRADGNEPVFSPEIIRTNVVPGENYALAERYPAGAKAGLVATLRTLAATPENLVIFNPTIGYLQYRGESAAAANTFSFAPIDPATGTWSATITDLAIGTINTLPSTYLFRRA